MSTGYIPVKPEDWAKMVEATKVSADLMVENKRLKDEVERLRKAGDKLASATIIFEAMTEQDRVQRRLDWLAAKEGGAK